MDASVSTKTEGDFCQDQDINNRPRTDVLLDVMYIIVGVIGITGNSFVLVVLGCVKELRTITNLLIANQSLLDLSASVLLMFRLLPNIPVSKERLIADTLVCTYWNDGELFWVAMIASTCNLIMITLERYYAVVHPIRYRKRATCTCRRIVFVACVPWLIGLLFTSRRFFTHRVGTYKCEYTLNQTGTAVAGAVSFFILYICPLGSMLFVYSRIYISLRMKVGQEAVRQNSNAPNVFIVQCDEDHMTTSKIGNREGTSGSIGEISTRPRVAERVPAPPPYRERARKNVITTLLIVSLTYVVCWTPNQIFYMVYSLGGPVCLGGVLQSTTVFLAICNISVNPIIYAFKYRRFRKGIKKLFLNVKDINGTDMANSAK